MDLTAHYQDENGLQDLLGNIWTKTKDMIDLEAIKAYMLSIWENIEKFICFIPTVAKTVYSTSKGLFSIMSDPNLYKHLMVGILYIVLRYIGLTNVANIMLGLYITFIADNTLTRIIGIMTAVLGFTTIKLDFDDMMFGPRSRVRHSGELAINAKFQSDDNELKPSPASSLATIAMLLGSMIFAFKINDFLPHDYEQFAKRMNAHSQVARGFSTIHDSFGYLVSGIKEAGHAFLGLDPNGADVLPVDVRENINLLTSFDATRKAQLHMHPGDVRKIIDGHDEYLRLRLIYSQNRALTPMLDRMQIGWVNLHALAQGHNQDPAGCRVVPIVMMLRGESGVGKSSVMYHIASYVLAEAGLINEETSDADLRTKIQTCAYPRASETTYWEGYKRQPITMVDDAFQVRDSISAPNLDVMELIRMSNPFPMPLNMAHLASKGNSNFDSRVIVYTTNVKRLKFESVISNEAIQNRVTMPYEVKIKAEFATPTGKLKSEYKTGAINTDVYEFYPWNVNTGALGPAPISFDELAEDLVKRMRRSRNNATTQGNDLVAHAKRAIERVKAINGEALLPEPEFGRPAVSDERIARLRMPRRPRRGWFQMEREEAFGGLGRRIQEPAPIDEDEFEERTGIELDAIIQPRKGWKSYLPKCLFSRLPTSKTDAQILQRAAWYCRRQAVPPLYSHFWEFLENQELVTELGLIDEVSYFDIKELFEDNAAELLAPLKDRLSNDFVTMSDLLEMVEQRTRLSKDQLSTSALVISSIALVAGSYALFSRLTTKEPEAWWKKIKVEDDYYKAAELKEDLIACDKDVLELGFVEPKRFQRIMAYLHWSKSQDRAVLESEEIDFSKQLRAQNVDKKYFVPSEELLESGTHRRHDAKTKLEENMESGTERHHKSKARLESGTHRSYTAKAKLEEDTYYQGWSNTNAYDIAIKIRKNVVRLVPIIDGKEVDTRVNALFIANRDLLLNEHYLDRFNTYAEQAESSFVISVRAVGSTTGTSYAYKDFIANKIPYMRGEVTTDLTLLRLDPRSGNRYASLLGFVIKAEQLNALPGRRAVLTVSDRDGWEKSFGEIQDPREVKINGKIYAGSYPVDLNSIGGDCGGYYITDDGISTRKLFGIHFAGSSKGAIATPLVYEDLEKIVDDTVTFDMELQEEDIPPMLVGNCVVRGRTDNGLTVPSKTALEKTAIFNQIIESEMLPAQISYSERKGGILDKALSKNFNEQPVIDSGTLNRAVESYEKMLSKTCNRRDMRKLTYDEAVAGVANDDYIRGVERATSAGWPACTTAKRGKTEWFGSDGPYTLDSARSVELKQKIENDIKTMKEGNFVRYTFMNVLKDETRPIEKVTAGKTRVFAACPIDFLIVFRMYFSSFFALMMENRIENESAVAIRAHSLEWTQLANRLKTVGNRMIAGDFSNYDGTLHSHILWKVYDIVERYYETSLDYCPSDALIRRVLWENIVSSENIVNNHIYQLNHSQPSGNPSTAILNSMYNSIACRYVYYAAGHSRFNENVRMIAYGDDNILSVSEEVDWDQQQMTTEFAKIGMTYTDEDKLGISSFRPLEEVSFLKRGFTQPFLGAQFAPLKIRSILECFNWIHKTPNERGVMEQNWEMANLELSFHPADVFDYWTLKIRTALAKQYGYRPQIKPRTAFLHAIRDGDRSLFDKAQWV
uniref:Putative nonstructural polyprotein n=1 Tax=Red panda dicistro-like virus TaxID=2864001 RepID=A0A8K1HI23_9VIRU|nr:putative nonstructural polyprotein [Red panda dicistro-like virus]